MVGLGVSSHWLELEFPRDILGVLVVSPQLQLILGLHNRWSESQ